MEAPKGFVLLTDKDGDPLLMRASEIHSIDALHDKDCSACVRGKSTWWVRHTVEEVAQKISEVQ